MKRMLINATQAEELRMAMVDGQRLFDLNIEGPASERKKANIYKGKITRIEPSLEAAFVDYGAERHGFLPLKEISSEYFVKTADSGKPNIKEVLKEGQDIVVQIDKEERGNKGAALTTFVSLAGRFIVLKPNKPRSGGVSRRIVGSDRDQARDSLSEVEIPENMSVILRTAGIDRSAEELAWDLENLLKVWQAILDTVLKRPSPFLIYRESNAVIRALRDYLTADIGEILVDDEPTYTEAREFVDQVMPHNARKLKHYTDAVPLFTRFQIESQIESAFAHQVSLPSGGSIVIDHTEALVAIDVNSARATKGGDIEATALNTNLEAAEEVARQLRIRDLGGLIVIDFIDMGPQKNQREVENRLREAVRQDRARVQLGKITRFGLLEMSRQRLRPSIGESAYQSCPRCSGFGTIRSIESLALAILRLIGEEARKERTAKVIAQLPAEVATYLLNEKRNWVQSLETNNDVQVVLVANSALETPHYDIRRVRDDQAELPENAGVSYSLAESDPLAEPPQYAQEAKVIEQPAIGVIAPTSPAPQRKKTGGFLVWLKGLFASDGEDRKERKASGSRGRSSPGSKRASDRSESRTRGDRKSNQGRNRQRSKKTSESAKPESRKSDSRKPDSRKSDSRKSDSRKSDSRKSDSRKSDAGKPEPRKSAGGEQEARQNQPSRESAGTPPQGENREEQKRSSRSRRSRGGRRRRRGAEQRDATDEAGNPKPGNGPTPHEQAPEHPEGIGNGGAHPGSPESAPRDVRPANTDAPAGPPKARTDAERVADSQKAAPNPADAAPPAKPEGRLLPWEPAAPPTNAEKPTARPAPDSQESASS